MKERGGDDSTQRGEVETQLHGDKWNSQCLICYAGTNDALVEALKALEGNTRRLWTYGVLSAWTTTLRSPE